MASSINYLLQSGRLEQVFIDGQWHTIDTGNYLAVINPATETVIGQLALCNTVHVNLAVAAAKKAFISWSQTLVSERIALLTKIHQLLLERAEIFAQALSLEMGAAINYARTAQVPLAAEHVRVAIENLSNYQFLTYRNASVIVREPIGVCGLITPWNWPLYQITAKVAPALAAGCTVVLKPSEQSPLSAYLFAELMQDAGTPAGVFNLLNGDGGGVGAPLSEHSDVDMISITGSTRAGVQVAQAAAPTVKRIAQELGGKSPNIILPDADLEKAIAPGVSACFRNVGQSCSAPTRMIVPRNKLAEVEQLSIGAISDIQMGNPEEEHNTHGPLSNGAQFERVQSLIQIGIDEGAKLITGGVGRPKGLETGFYVKPTIFSDVTSKMRIAQEEIFGPVLVIIPYDSVEEAITIANDTIYGLGAHIQGSDMDVVKKVASTIRSGQVHLNYPAWDPYAPFGGYKSSGTGREFGIEGLEEYLETKAIIGFI